MDERENKKIIHDSKCVAAFQNDKKWGLTS